MVRILRFGVHLPRWARCAAAVVVLASASGCGTTSLLLTATGAATDISPTMEIVKHIHGKLTEGDPVACRALNSVERAFNERCGAYQPGSLKAADVANSGLPVCPLTLAARNPVFWPMVPELLERGAQPDGCAASPLAALAETHSCPDFTAASPQVLQSLRWLADADPRAVQHDVVRLLSCPSARSAGLDTVIDGWLADGALSNGKLPFGPLGALHPDHLNSRLSLALEAHGHTAQQALGAYAGKLPSGFEEALRTSHMAALDWWLRRVPELANRVPPRQSNQLAWVPLARVLVPTFLERPEMQPAVVEFLMSRGANPWEPLPGQPGRTVVHQAQAMASPVLPLLHPAVAVPPSKPEALARQ